MFKSFFSMQELSAIKGGEMSKMSVENHLSNNKDHATSGVKTYLPEILVSLMKCLVPLRGIAHFCHTLTLQMKASK